MNNIKKYTPFVITAVLGSVLLRVASRCLR